MQKRGRILRDPISGPGLLMVDGQQYPFSLEGVWKSDVAPASGMVVDVAFDSSFVVTAVSSVPESQIAKEQAEVALAAAKEKGAALASGALAKFGAPNLIASALLIASWFFLTTVSFKSPLGAMDFTLWQVLGYLNAKNALEVIMSGGRGGPSPGIYGFFAVVAIAGPYVRYFWKDTRAALGGALPLVFLAIVGISARSSINSMIGGAADGPLGEIQRQAQQQMSDAISLGLGTYVGGLASLYLAVFAAKQFFLQRATDTSTPARSKQAAA